MIAGTIAQVLEGLHDGIEFVDEGDDFPLMHSDADRARAERTAKNWGEINDARSAQGVAAWDGLITQHAAEACAESNPELKFDRLLLLAAHAIAYAGSVKRQTAVEDAVVDEIEDDE